MGEVTLNNRYQFDPIHDEIGRGGLATVYKAYDLQLKRNVALKRFKIEDADDKYSLENEIQRAIDFQHPNLLRYYDFFNHTYHDEHQHPYQVQYGVMELIDEGDLSHWLKQNPDESQLLQVFTGILKGLDYLHRPDVSTGKPAIVHRDIKPSNILLKRASNGDLIPKICDFNISKATNAEQTDASKSFVGTFEYMSPEQINPAKFGINGKTSANTDLWALGVMLFDHLNPNNESLLGKRSEGTTQGQILDNILNKNIPVEQIDKLPAPFNEIVKLCLVRDAHKRVQTAEELLKIIEKVPLQAKKEKRNTHRENTTTGKKNVTDLPPTIQNAKTATPKTSSSPFSWKIWFSVALFVLIGLSALIGYFIEEENKTEYPDTLINSPDTTRPKIGIRINETKSEENTTSNPKLLPLNRTKVGLKSISQLQKDNDLIKQYIADNRLIAQPTGSGLYFAMSRLGLGKKPTLENTVVVNQKGYLLNGTVFDSSYDRGKPDELPLNALIPGWQEGLQIFREGSKGILLIPSALAYGEAGATNIPPNSVLIFDIELLEVK
ncbi:MAG: protein kinase [Sphingobacteriales bacterium]|nr:MAG: protein kinase [Sphingobacteriales bacterium]